MEKNEIKKALYRQNPLAELNGMASSKEDTIYHYETKFKDEDGEDTFDVPVSDMGDATFEKEMEAKHLIRWITK